MKMTKWSLSMAVILLGFSLPAATAAQSVTKTLKVKVSYTGQGEVDSSHRIHLFLFNTPEINAQSTPVGWTNLDSNGQQASISGLTDERVYLVAVYDQSGSYNEPTGPPPAGTPVSMYRPGEPAPTPIAMDQPTVELEFSFDDSVRMP